MQLHKLISIASILFFFVLGCSKSSDSSAGPGTDLTPVPNQVAEKISANAKMPDLGDFKTLEFLMFYDLTNDTCVYQINEKTTISLLSATSIEHTYDRTSKADGENSAACPAQHPDFIAHGAISWGIGRYPQMRIEAIKQGLDPAEFQKNAWVQSARIISSKELNQKGLRIQMVEMEVISKKGVRYSLKQNISLDSLFLARTEYLRARTDNGSIINYQLIINYSVKKLGLY